MDQDERNCARIELTLLSRPRVQLLVLKGVWYLFKWNKVYLISTKHIQFTYSAIVCCGNSKELWVFSVFTVCNIQTQY